MAPGTVIQSIWANTTVTDIGNELTNSLPRDGQAPMTGVLKIIDGTSNIPGLSFNSDSATGLFRPAAGSVGVAVSGTEQLRITTTGIKVTGTTSLSDGAVGAPTLTFTSESNTGLYRAGAGTLAVAVGGVQVGTFTSSGFTGTAAAVPWSGITSKPTTVAGYGVTDATAINPVTPKDGDVKVAAGPIVSVYATGAWRQFYPPLYS